MLVEEPAVQSLTDRAEFDRLINLALKAAEADHVFVSLSDRAGGTTRIANNQIVQNVATRRRQLSISVAFETRHGRASTTDLTEQAIRDAAAQAVAIARSSPPDPEYMPPLGPQQYPVLVTLRHETAEVGPARRAAEAGRAIDLCREAGLEAAGIVESYVESAGLAASTGLRAFEQRSDARFSLTATGTNSSGWVNNASRSFDDLNIESLARTAVDKALRSADPQELEAGRYTVILEPAAVAGLLGPLSFSLGAKSYHRGTSALSGKLGQPILHEHLTLRNRPDHPQLMGRSFDGQGLPADFQVWIDGGVLRRIDYDRFTAAEHNTQPTYGLDAPHLSGTAPAGAGVESLIEGTERGILVTNFWYIRSVNPTDLTLTGMTRDGTFLVEDGQVRCGLLNFRWHDSPLRALREVLAYTTPQEAITMERGKMLLPALKIADFNFSSVTRF